MTVHRWFANKSCPGDYLFNLHGYIAAEVNKRLGVTATETPTIPEVKIPEKNPDTTVVEDKVVPFKVRVIVPDLNYRSQPSMQGKVKGQTGRGIFTIVQVTNGWGKLKSGAGWIWLKNPAYCTIL